MLDIFDQKLQ
jgi:Kelch motif